MPLHWKEIKGFNGTGDDDLLYTYLKFQILDDEDNMKAYEHRPHIFINTTDLGYIVCNEVNNNFGSYLLEGSVLQLTSNPSTAVYNLWTEDEETTSGLVRYADSNNIYTKLHSTNYLNLYAYTAIKVKTSGNYKLWTDNFFELHNVGTSSQSGFYANNQISFFTPRNYSVSFYSALQDAGTNPTNTNRLLSIQYNSTQDARVNITYNELYSLIPVNATYFNARSDRRAKDNIQPLTTSVLDIINSIPVYSFNYKNDTHDRSIGLIAQDLIDIDLDNFNLVTNPKATGNNGDYMNIHESKIVYVLWKAVQELTAEINILKQQFNK